MLIEGLCVHGMFPYLASLLADQGEPRLSIAGLVLAGFAIGGIIYSLAVGFLLNQFGEKGFTVGGGLMVALQLGVIALVPYWPVQFAAFIALGIGFYMLHGVLQLYATELSDEARGSAMSLHSASFFLGQAVGPVAYGFGLSHVGAPASFLTAAVLMAALGIFCALTLRHRARR